MNDYEAICAKSHAVYGKLLTRGDYQILASCGTLTSLSEKLSEYDSYRTAFTDSDFTKITRIGIERAASHGYFSVILRFIAFAKTAQAEFLTGIAEEYEIKYLLRVIKACGGEIAGLYLSVPDYLRRYSKINFQSAISSGTYAGILSALSGTVYYGAAAAELSKKEPNISHLENALYSDYYSRLYGEYSEALGKKSAEAVRPLIRDRLAQINEERIRRAEKFGISADSLILTPKNIKPVDTPINSEKLCEICTRTIHSGGGTMAVPLALIMLCGQECENIIHLTEGIRYGAAPGTIMEKIICR